MEHFATPLCSKPFIEGLHKGLILFQSCISCSKTQNLSRYRCLQCGATEMIWRPSSGLGTVEAVTQVRRAAEPFFQALAPYVIVLVHLREGFNLMAIQDPQDLRRSHAMQISDVVRLSVRQWGERYGFVASH